MIYRLELVVPRLPRLNTSSWVHWRVKHSDRGDWAVLMRAALGDAPKPAQPLERSRLTFERHSSSEPDYTNLVQSFKLIEDLLQPPSPRNPGGISIIANDARINVGVPEFKWEKAQRNKGYVRIIVEEVE